MNGSLRVRMSHGTWELTNGENPRTNCYLHILGIAPIRFSSEILRTIFIEFSSHHFGSLFLPPLKIETCEEGNLPEGRRGCFRSPWMNTACKFESSIFTDAGQLEIHHLNEQICARWECGGGGGQKYQLKWTHECTFSLLARALSFAPCESPLFSAWRFKYVTAWSRYKIIL